MNRSCGNTSIFIFLGCFILGWWLLAFSHQSTNTSTNNTTTPNSTSLNIQTNALLPYLSPLSRTTLHKALSGNKEAIVQLISRWDSDAQILQAKGINGIQRLDTDTYLQAHAINVLLQESSAEQIHLLNNQLRIKTLFDDNEQKLEITHPLSHFLPQTFTAASILLAITKPDQIIGLPKGMRDRTHIYPSKLLDQIPHNFESFHGEKLFLANPDLTFISPYSNPSVLSALKNQGLKLYVIKNIESLKGIQETILKLGHAVNCPLEANLLSIFLDATFMAIDNRIKALFSEMTPTDSQKKVLYLYYDQHFSIPTTKCLAGQLVKRAFNLHPGYYYHPLESPDEWRVPVESEKILLENPNYFVISSEHNDSNLQKRIEHQTIIGALPEKTKKKIYFLDEQLLSSVDQYVALAYFDIYQILAAMQLP
ncbi:MAG: ABC transporter substrate-binding protein [Parachlamydiaceae bacterium]|nr:ABC transporter substrate-binding protein [Parachlamydiaceae bacterium]